MRPVEGIDKASAIREVRPARRLHRAGADLLGKRRVGAEQELLAGLAPGVERAGHLRAAEGAVVEQAAVLARERHTLRHALVDDVHADLGQTMHVRLTRAEEIGRAHV